SQLDESAQQEAPDDGVDGAQANGAGLNVRDDDADQTVPPADDAPDAPDLVNAAVDSTPTADAPTAGVAYDDPVTLQPPDREDAGPYELEESRAISLALEHRLDLRIALWNIIDLQRGVAIAAANLRADLTLLGSGSAGS